MSCNASVWDRIFKNRCKICVLFVRIRQAYKWYSQMKSNFLFVYQQELFLTIDIKNFVSVDGYLEISKSGEYLSNNTDIILIFFCSIKHLTGSLPFLNWICCVSRSSLLQRRLVNSEIIDVIWIASHLFVSNYVKKYLIEVINHGKIREKTVKVYWIMNVLIFGWWMKSM